VSFLSRSYFANSPKSSSALTGMIWLISFTHVLFLWIGVRRSYSGIPFWDEWDSRYRFYSEFLQNPISSIFDQHNEHRIVLTKLIFVFDFWVFNGSAAPLIILNLLLSLAISILVCKILIQYINAQSLARLNWTICPLVFAVNSSWLQQGNFTWAFQSQYFLAVLIPLLFFNYSITLWIKESRKYNFIGIFVLAILSSWSISGGLIVIPILILVSLMLRRPKYEISILCILFLSVLMLYSINFDLGTDKYKQLSDGSSSIKAIIKFFLTYMSSPIVETFGISYAQGILIFALLWGSALFILYNSARLNSFPDIPSIVLFSQLLFTLALAGVTSLGRFQFGNEQAEVAMYKTPSIVGWGIVGSVVLIAINKKFSNTRAPVLLLVLTVLLTSLPSQQKAVSDFSQWVNTFKLSAVALKLGINDKKQLDLIYYDSDELLQISKPFVRKNFEPFSSIGIEQDQFLESGKLHNSVEDVCIGNVDSQENVDENYLKLSGWILNLANLSGAMNPSAKELFLLDSEGAVNGYGLQGFIHKDAIESHSTAKYSGFYLYALKEGLNSELLLYSPSYKCNLQISVEN